MSWTCPDCMYDSNPPTIDTCMLCNTQRQSLVRFRAPPQIPVTRPPPSSAPPEPQTASSKLHPWQEEALVAIKRQNTIVMIPTGGGKTLIGVRAIDHYSRLYPNKKAMFVVPTVSLVRQQASYLEQFCQPRKRASRVSGPVMDSWSQQQWDDCLRSVDIVVGTPAVFQNALLTTGFLVLSDFYIIVFDECHHAVGNSPMVGIMNHVVKHPPDRRPVILGLTGSFNNGAMTNVEKKKKRLEMVLTAQMCCPQMGNFEAQQNKVWLSVEYDGSDCTEAGKAFVESKLDLVLTPWAASFRDRGLRTRLLATAGAVYENLGMAGWTYFVREGIVKQLIEDSQAAEQYGGKPVFPAATLIQFRDYLRSKVDSVGPELTRTPIVSNKFRRLLTLLEDKRAELKQLRVLIFVERIASTNPLADLLNRDFVNHAELAGLRAAAVCGTGAMNDDEREARLTEFRRGELAVLVCTASLEEGIDVPECNLVVRFDEFKTTKQHIQGSGRARCPNAQIVYFVNDVQTEISHQTRMEQVARDKDVTVTPAQMEAHLQSRPVFLFHPYKHGTAGQYLDIFNAQAVVYEYVQKTMKALVPEALWVTRKEVIRGGPPGEFVEVIEAFEYPSPKGVQSIDFDDVRAMWGSSTVKDVGEDERIKRWSAFEAEQRRFLYTAAIDMVKRGYLDEHNSPSGLAMQENLRHCPPYRMSTGLNIRNDYKHAETFTGLPRSSPTTASSSASFYSGPSLSSSGFGAMPGYGQPPQVPNVPRSTSIAGLPRLTPQFQVPVSVSSVSTPRIVPTFIHQGGEIEAVKRKVLTMLAVRGPMFLSSFVNDYADFNHGKEDLDFVLRTVRVGTFLFNYCGCTKVGGHQYGPPDDAGRSGIGDRYDDSSSRSSRSSSTSSISSGSSSSSSSGTSSCSCGNNNNSGSCSTGTSSTNSPRCSSTSSSSGGSSGSSGNSSSSIDSSNNSHSNSGSTSSNSSSSPSSTSSGSSNNSGSGSNGVNSGGIGSGGSGSSGRSNNSGNSIRVLSVNGCGGCSSNNNSMGGNVFSWSNNDIRGSESNSRSYSGGSCSGINNSVRIVTPSRMQSSSIPVSIPIMSSSLMSSSPPLLHNYKGLLQEKLQRMYDGAGLYMQPQYIARTVGTSLSPEFEVRVRLSLPRGVSEFVGKARTKKAAEQAAACNALATSASW